jgi:hypothetical protein
MSRRAHQADRLGFSRAQISSFQMQLFTISTAASGWPYPPDFRRVLQGSSPGRLLATGFIQFSPWCVATG